MSVCDETKPYIFISYSHKDTVKVVGILNRLREEGYNVWYDEGIDPGTEWDENIARHVKECSYFIAFVSQGYIGSNNCKDELNYSRDLDKEQLLVYLEDVELPDGMAMRMNRIQAIWWNKYDDSNIENAYEKLFSASGIEKTKIYKKGEGDKLVEIPSVKVNSGAGNSSLLNAKSNAVNKKIYIAAGIVVALVIIAIIAIFGGKKKDTADLGDQEVANAEIEDAKSDEEAKETSDDTEMTASEEATSESVEEVEYQEVKVTSDFAEIVFEVPTSAGFVGYPKNRATLEADSLAIRKDGNGDKGGRFLFYNVYTIISNIDQNLTKFDIGYAAYDENDQLLQYSIMVLDNELTNKHVADEGVSLEVGNKFNGWGWLPYGTTRVRIFAETEDGKDCYEEASLKEEFEKMQQPHIIGLDSEFGHLDIETPGIVQDFDYKTRLFVMSAGNVRENPYNDLYYLVDIYFYALDTKPENTDENNSYKDEKVAYVKTAGFDENMIVKCAGLEPLRNATDDTLPITSGWIYKREAGVLKGTSLYKIYTSASDIMNSYYKVIQLKDGTEVSLDVLEGERNVGSTNDHNFRMDFDYIGLSEDPEDSDKMLVTIVGKDIVNANGNKEFVLNYEVLDDKYNVIATGNDIIKNESGFNDGDGCEERTYRIPKEARHFHLFGNYLDGRDCYK